MTQIQADAGEFADLAWKVGDRFRKAREIRTGMTRAAFAEALDVSRDTIQKIEESNEVPKALYVMGYSNLTDVPVSWFKQDSDGAPTPPDDTPKLKRPRLGSNQRPTAYNSPVSTLTALKAVA